MTRTGARREARWALGTVLVLGALACGSGGDGAVTLPPGGGAAVAPLDVTGWVAATDGTMPLVIVAPHGGDLVPTELPDRTCAGCETVNDANTRALAIEIADAFARRIGKRPFVVANLLSRRKFDANRDLTEATGSYAPLAPLWTLFHQRIDSAKARAARVHPRALLIDLHGHAHAVPRLELGYLLSAANLRLPDSIVTPLMFASSIARLDSSARSGDAGVVLLRGARSLGTRFAQSGFPAVPSASDPAPAVSDAYFNGGYDTQRHGSQVAGPVDAIQIECNYAGVRDTPAARANFAEAFVTATLAYLADHYGWVPA
ncbi:MAG: hypothetical protein K8S21_03210 [Gemmatimonadetes bacterium]|nr:hypothetical protein [Gemmatimonadota bacterium]